MKIFKLSFLLALSFMTISNSSASSNFTDEQIAYATSSAKLLTCFEDHTTQQAQKEEKDRCDFLTLEEFKFEHKGKADKFCIVVGSWHGSLWGEVAVYPENVDYKKIRYGMGAFSDLGDAALYLSYIKFEYVPSAESHPSYIILEKVSAGYKSEGKGYSQACVDYFVKEFVQKHTKVDFVFSDLRNPACVHFFPRSGFQLGIADQFKDHKFSRPLQKPAYWMRKNEK